MKWIRRSTRTYYEEIFEAAKTDNKKKFRQLFLKLHDKDQMELFHLLYPEKKKKIADFLSPEEFASILEYMDLEDQLDAVQYLPADYMASVFHYMADDNVVRFLSETEEVERDALLALMDKEDRQMVETLLSYAPETAGSIMTTRMIVVSNKETVKEVTEKLKTIGHQAETIYYLYVVDEARRLIGVVSLKELILSPEEERIDQVMFPHVVSVNIDDDQEAVAHLIQEYDFLAIPVVSGDRELRGIITVDDVMDVLEEEAIEDFNEFAGITKTKKSEDSILQTARSRTPWIVALVFLGMISANLIGFFEETLESVVALAAFIPIIMDSAGNVGTQALAVSVRRFSNEPSDTQPKLPAVLLKEFAAGILIGSAAAVTVILLVMVLYQDWLLAVVIGTSLLVTLSFSTVVGALVPVFIRKLNIDPAVASGPFITTINDGFGLLIYFSIATALLKMN